MAQRSNVVTFKGNPITLVGEGIKVGQKAPDFQLTATDMSTKTLGDFAGKVKVVSIVPSLDTPVCDTQTRKFNEAASSLGSDVVVLTVSMDLPMAQKRWCGAAGVDRVVCLSDYKDHSFGKSYGVRIQELGLLTRAVLVLDRDDVVRYQQLVGEVTQEPDYQAALEAAKRIV
ncbi:MAG TPA: thiol peroxidase [Phycisphaeraceae bacterium]